MALAVESRQPALATVGPSVNGGRLRVAMMIQSYWPVLGGAQRQVQQLGPLLEHRGVAVTVVTRRPPGAPLRAAEPGVELRRLRVPPIGAAASVVYTAHGAVVLSHLRPDVIHVHDLLSPATAALIASARSPRPVVAKVLSTGLGGDIDRLLQKPFGARRLALMARRFAAFVCLSEEVEQELAAHGVSRERLHRIPNGVDTRRFRPPAADERERQRRQLAIPDNAVVALYCGRLAPVKRPTLLVEAARAAGAHLVIAGAGSERSRLKALATPENGVRLIDTVDDPLPLYHAADVYVSASTTEGMSGAVLEAMSSGLPIVASPASGMSELVMPSTGFIAADEGAESLGRALAALVEDGDMRARKGRAARELVASRYSLDSTADMLVELYRDLLRRSREHAERDS